MLSNLGNVCYTQGDYGVPVEYYERHYGHP
jgi:hypothetical protein